MTPDIDSLAATLTRYRQEREAAERDLNKTIDRTRNELKEKHKAVEDTIRGEWNTLALACRKMSLLLSSCKTADIEVPDQEWINITLKLRSGIEYFTIYFFAGEPPPNISAPLASSVLWKQTLVSEAGLTTVQPFFNSYMKTIPNFEHYLLSNLQCPDLIQNFLWMVLLDQVFGQYQWAGAARKPMVDLGAALFQGMGGAKPDPDIKTHLWRKFTNRQIFDSLSRTPKEVQDFDRLVRIQYLADRITEVIRPFARERQGLDGRFTGILHSLLESAISLDRLICMQMACLGWRVPDAKGLLVTHPALVRRGTSDGTSFEGETVLCNHKISDPRKTVRWPPDSLYKTQGQPIPD